jgi:transposase-like protein
MSMLSAPHFHNEKAAYAWVEARIWPNGPVCPHCAENKRVSLMGGKSTRIGAYKCYACRKPFTVKVGTIFEASHIPMRLWLQAIFLLTSSKKGISSNQLHRTLGVTLKTAWFMSHRIREAMREGGLVPMGGDGTIVEADETYLWSTEVPKPRSRGRIPTPTKRGKSGPADKRAIISLVERGGNVRSFHVENADKLTVNRIVTENIARETRMHTDESRIYGDVEQHVTIRETVRHSAKEYARGDVNTNSVEGYFGILKRGMKGIYQHCKEKHLHRYLAEYDFRYNHRIKLGVNDAMRAERALMGVAGKRLTYETIGAR